MKLKLLLLFGWLACGLVWSKEPAAPDILAGLQPEHPRLLLTSNDWVALRAPRPETTETAAILAKTVADARLVLGAPPLVYQKEGWNYFKKVI